MTFNWKHYLAFNKDLEKSGITSEQECINHYEKFGKKEKRKINISEVYPDFDWMCYRAKYDDLKCYFVKEELENHWIKYGRFEGRSYLSHLELLLISNRLKLFNPDYFDELKSQVMNLIEKLIPNTDNQTNISTIDFINQKMIGYNDNPVQNKKLLVVISCHLNCLARLFTIINNLRYFSNYKIVVVNSTKLKYNKQISKYFAQLGVQYIERNNNKMCDFGKWKFYLKNNSASIKSYDYVILTNDSFIINGSVNYFLNSLALSNRDLYAYTDSIEMKYHYQSYLFGLSTRCINQFINFVKNSSQLVTCFNDLIIKVELRMVDEFYNCDCFLKITPIVGNNNVFFTNDVIFNALRKSGLLPITKLKRISIS